MPTLPKGDSRTCDVTNAGREQRRQAGWQRAIARAYPGSCDKPDSPHRGYAIAIAVLLAVVLAYLPALRGGFIWDDDAYVTENDTLRSLDGLRRTWLELGATPQYYPLVHTTFWIEYRLWGLHPLGYHLVNVLLHALSAVLLGLLLRRLRVPGAWLAAGLFALHPVHVESVAWITERKNVLSGACYLASLLAYRRFARLGDNDAAPRSWPFYALSVLLYTLALFAKTVTCTLPVAILLLTWWRRGRLTWRDVGPTVPMFAVGAVLAGVTVWMEAHHVGAARVAWDLTLVDRGLIAGRAVAFYLGKLLWPHPLSFIYPRWTIDAGLWWPYLYPLAAILVLVGLHLTRRWLGRGPLVAALYFGMTLAPALGFVNIYPMRYSFVADHFQYLASIGPLTLLAAWITNPLGRRDADAPRGRRTRRTDHPSPRVAARRPLGAVLTWLPVALLGVLAGLTWQQARSYRDPETLWRHTLATNPGAWMAHNNLGDWLLRQGRIDEAATHFAEAIRLEPDDAFAHNNLAITLQRQGQPEAAIGRFRQALHLRPDYAEAHCNLAGLLAERGRNDEALAHLAESLRLQPVFPEAHLRRGDVYAALGRRDEAVAAYQRALQIRPDLVEARNNLGAVLLAQGRVEEAISQFHEALRIDPHLAAAYNNLGNASIKSGDFEAAAEHFRRATQLDPDSVSAWSNLAGALRRLGHNAQAIDAYREALFRQPDDADLHALLGLALAAEGRREEAVAAFKQALHIDPRHGRARRALEAASQPGDPPPAGAPGVP